MKKIIFLVICIVIGIVVYHKSNEIVIPLDSIRVRIIANSNNIEDLYQKKKLKEEIKNDLYELVKNSKNSKEARESIENNLSQIEKIVSSKTSDYKISYGNNYFPKKVYKGVIYPEGEYESLVITLGNGLGYNWWCVLYPPLCLIEEDANTDDVEYRLMISRLFDNN